MSSVETGQMSAVETGQVSAAETRQMYSIKTGQSPLGSSWGDEKAFDPFFLHLKCAKWNTPGGAGGDGNATTGGCAEPHSTRAGGQDYVSS